MTFGTMLEQIRNIDVISERQKFYIRNSEVLDELERGRNDNMKVYLDPGHPNKQTEVPEIDNSKNNRSDKRFLSEFAGCSCLMCKCYECVRKSNPNSLLFNKSCVEGCKTCEKGKYMPSMKSFECFIKEGSDEDVSNQKIKINWHFAPNCSRWVGVIVLFIPSIFAGLLRYEFTHEFWWSIFTTVCTILTAYFLSILIQNITIIRMKKYLKKKR